MKKTVFTLLFFLFASRIFACSWYSPDYVYYNLFVQEVMDEPRYFPFLLTKENWFYESDLGLHERNENIEDWQKHLAISYDQAHYLVFESERATLLKILAGDNTTDEKLNFITQKFVRKHKQDLRYLVYAKYLAPYMRISGSEKNYWDNEKLQSVSALNYETVISKLKKSWKKADSKNLKLRYGYQLVRFAHYSRMYSKAICFFDTYVESLDYRPIMYYYALDQKAGAERALGNLDQANYDFFQFFTHTKNRKQSAYISLQITNGLHLKNLLAKAKNETERNDIYLLMGYNDFNNPLAAFEKIVVNSPNAPQAKVLMARAINQLERNFFPLVYHCPYDEQNCLNHIENTRLPITLSKKYVPFLEQVLQASVQQIENPAVQDHNFWGLTTAYLYFIQKKYDKAKTYLAKVKSTEKPYDAQKEKLALLIEITAQETITPAFEEVLITKYKKYLGEAPTKYEGSSTQAFIADILANRYFLQKEYTRSFLMHNNVRALEYKPNLQILRDIENLYYKKNKTNFEKYLAKNCIPTIFGYHASMKAIQEKNVSDYFANMTGSVFLSQGNFKKALQEFKKVNDDFTLLRSEHIQTKNGEWIRQRKEYFEKRYNGYSNISSKIFGYNRFVCFSCSEDQTMRTDYLEDFAFIKNSMNKRELAENLVKLAKIARGNDEKAAKANYLIGNFLFNTSLLGYYRHILTFSIGNYNSRKYHGYAYRNGYYNNYSDQKSPFQFYLKAYKNKASYVDDFQLPLQYLKRALQTASNDELKARILFAAAKCEQGGYYQNSYKDKAIKTLNQKKKDREITWKEYRREKWTFKENKYGTYFQQLENYHQTNFYDEVKTNCKYFAVYVSRFEG